VKLKASALRPREVAHASYHLFIRMWTPAPRKCWKTCQTRAANPVARPQRTPHRTRTRRN